MRKTLIFLLALFIGFGMNAACYGDQIIVAQKVDTAPLIDGSGDDAAWNKAEAIVTHDKIADIDINLKAVYTDREIFFMASFPDAGESITHKTWVWSNAAEMYKTGTDREDTFVFKWNMETDVADFYLTSDSYYAADIWFWKACRTDPVGYADDKHQHLGTAEIPKSYKVVSKSGNIMYLTREGDEGKSAYKDTLYADYQGETMPRYTNPIPTGSRADVRAKGAWQDGRWTIEFRRALTTGNTDDIQFDTSNAYSFGVSRHEIAGRPPDPEIDQPLYGSGEIGEVLTLEFGGWQKE